MDKLIRNDVPQTCDAGRSKLGWLHGGGGGRASYEQTLFEEIKGTRTKGGRGIFISAKGIFRNDSKVFRPGGFARFPSFFLEEALEPFVVPREVRGRWALLRLIPLPLFSTRGPPPLCPPNPTSLSVAFLSKLYLFVHAFRLNENFSTTRIPSVRFKSRKRD